MNPRLRISGGFALLCVSWLGCTAFTAWGLKEPPLDRAQPVLDHLERDDPATLGKHEARLLQVTLDEFPDLSRALVGSGQTGFVERVPGSVLTRPHVHWVVMKSLGPALQIRFTSRAAAAAYPLRVRLEGSGFARTLVFKGDGRQTLELPAGYPRRPLWLDFEVLTATPLAPFALRVSDSEEDD